MKTNYTSKISQESEEVLSNIADYAAGNMVRTKNKSKLYAKIIGRCTAMIDTSLLSS
jgi:hypothetical protein